MKFREISFSQMKKSSLPSFVASKSLVKQPVGFHQKPKASYPPINFATSVECEIGSLTTIVA